MQMRAAYGTWVLVCPKRYVIAHPEVLTFTSDSTASLQNTTPEK
jgi:hypothetical protein